MATTSSEGVAAPLGLIVVSVLLLAGVLLTSLAVVYSSHESRLLFGELLDLQKQSFDMEDEWGRLLLERRTYASVDRVEKIAVNELSMVVPEVQVLHVRSGQ